MPFLYIIGACYGAGKAKALGYKIVLIFFWPESVELAAKRVKHRVKQGGHNIQEAVIKRRYKRGLKNLYNFILVSDHWVIWDNSKGPASIIALATKMR